MPKSMQFVSNELVLFITGFVIIRENNLVAKSPITRIYFQYI